MKYKIFSLSDACEIETTEGDQAAAIAALKVNNNTPGLLAWGAYAIDGKTWLYFHQPDTQLTRRLLFMGFEMIPSPAEPTPEIAAPQAAPGARWQRMLAALNKAPAKVVDGLSADKVEHLIDSHGPHVRPEVLAFLEGHATKAHAFELAEETAAAAPAPEPEAVPQRAGAKHLRNQETLAVRAAQESVDLERQQIAAVANVDPRAASDGWPSAKISEFLADFAELLTPETTAFLAGLADGRAVAEREAAEIAARQVNVMSDAAATPQIPAAGGKVAASAGDEAAPPKKPSRAKKSAQGGAA